MLAAGALLAAPYAGAQQRTAIPLVGLLDAGERLVWWDAFKRGMKDLGYVDGKNVRYEPRFAQSDFGRLSAYADELVRLGVSVIVTAATEATQAAQRATDRVPIVTGSGGDHVSKGFAKSLARPGGNITGLSSQNSDLVAKRLELLRELLPRMTRLAVLWQSNSIGSTVSFREIEIATRALGIVMQNIGVRKSSEFADAFAAAASEHANAVFVIGAPLTIDGREQIAALARQHRLPTMGSTTDFALAGLLASYGVDFSDLFRRAAHYVDKILKGARPGDLPIEQPTKFELAINKGTAKSLSIAIPQTLLLRADRIVG
jgi:putative ABC transport system substrate-binding protein